MRLNETHDPARLSWVDSANAAGVDFPIQNLPFGVFRRKSSGATQYVGPARETFYRQLLDQLKTVPGIESASAINHLPHHVKFILDKRHVLGLK